MRIWKTLAPALLVLVTHQAFAEVAPPLHDTHPDDATAGIPAAAVAAVAAVDRFTMALAKGDLEGARAELDPNVLILESGGAERSAAVYMGSHAMDDAAFLKTAHQRLLHRTAYASGDLAWVASESELQLQQADKPVTLLSTETMVLQRSTGVWKIVHIHWSSRRKAPGADH